MMLYVNGDSHSNGMQLLSENKFANQVADYFNLSLNNVAQIGASNQRIIRTTREYIAQGHRPTLIIIGWSTWEREEWEHEGKYYNVNSSGHDVLPDALVDQYKSWVLDQSEEVLAVKSAKWHNEIYQLHLELKQQQLDHVFFNCMYNFFNVQSQLDWDNCYVHPYHNEYSLYWYLKKQGFVTDDWYHYGADGNRAWADFLIEFIKSNNIL
jgi:hypothetical protein